MLSYFITAQIEESTIAVSAYKQWCKSRCIFVTFAETILYGSLAIPTKQNGWLLRLFVFTFAATTPFLRVLKEQLFLIWKKYTKLEKKVLCDKQPCLLLTCKNIGLMAGGIATLDLRFISLTKPHSSSSCLSHGFKTVWNLI